MNAIIVDASVGIKWFVPEVHAAEATIVACRRIRPACAGILFRIGNRQHPLEETAACLTQIRVLPLSRHAESPLLTAALDLAERTQRTVYDCLYLALAMQTSGHMVTADQRLFNAVSTTPYAPFICWVGNAPPGP